MRDEFLREIGPMSAEEYAGTSWLNVAPADAKLIAAAPDLLAEVERLRKVNAVLVSALKNYAEHKNWAEMDDSYGCTRVWNEPGTSTPERFNGYEIAEEVLKKARES